MSRVGTLDPVGALRGAVLNATAGLRGEATDARGL
jgi:hypothetical protein